MDITEELLKTIYNRVNQYCFAKYNSEADSIEIDDGYIYVKFISRGFGHREEEESHIIDVECLSQDLDDIYKKRKIKEEEDKIKREVEQKRQQKIIKLREKKERKAMYEKLKKEFDN